MAAKCSTSCYSSRKYTCRTITICFILSCLTHYPSHDAQCTLHVQYKHLKSHTKRLRLESRHFIISVQVSMSRLRATSFIHKRRLCPQFSACMIRASNIFSAAAGGRPTLRVQSRSDIIRSGLQVGGGGVQRGEASQELRSDVIHL